MLALVVAIHFAVGCGSTGRMNGAFRESPVDELHLMSMPLALNLDSIPGVDGIALKVYAVNRLEPKTIPFRSGRLQIDMFEGAVQDAVTASQAPLKTWTFTPEDLQNLEFKTPVGIGYSFTLRWGDSVPMQSKVTVIGRYLSPQGQTVYSAPNAISVASQ